jgi:hypothetical protein
MRNQRFNSTFQDAGVTHMTLRLGEHGLDRFAGCANELSVCANRVEE